MTVGTWIAQLRRRRARRHLGARGRLHADGDGRRVPARAVRLDVVLIALALDRAPAWRSPRSGLRLGVPVRRRLRESVGARGGRRRWWSSACTLRHAELGPRPRTAMNSFSEADEARARERSARRCASRRTLRPRIRAASISSTARSRSCGACCRSVAGPLRVGDLDRPVRADRAALRRDLVRARRPAADEPRDHRRRRARNDLRAGRASRRRSKSRTRSSAGIRSRLPPTGAATVFYGIWPALVVAAALLVQQEAVHEALFVRRRCRAALARDRWRRCCAADIKVDLSKEQVGKPPVTFEPMVGTWVIAQDGAEKVDHGRRPAVGGEQGQPDQAADRERAQALRHLERRADGQREAVRLLPGRGARKASTTSRTARSA